MSGRTTSRQLTEAERRAQRLAELVSELTGCEQSGALHAVREHQHEDRPDALDLVARAMIDVDAARQEPLRVPPFIEHEDGTRVLDLSDGAAGAGVPASDDEDLFGPRLAHARRAGNRRPTP